MIAIHYGLVALGAQWLFDPNPTISILVPFWSERRIFIADAGDIPRSGPAALSYFDRDRKLELYCPRT
jgi:hypothetical protein